VAAPGQWFAATDYLGGPSGRVDAPDGGIVRTLRSRVPLCIPVAHSLGHGLLHLLRHVVTILHVPQRLITFLAELDVAPWQFIILVCIIFIFLGDFLEVVSITIITLPIIFPILLAIGIDPVWFAVIMTINMEFALITPPVGLNLFVIKGVVEDASLMEVFQGTLPFMLLMLAVLVLVILFPQLSLWLPFMVR
jgi:C4-dicarboxylate transporter DctM subunit